MGAQGRNCVNFAKNHYLCTNKPTDNKTMMRFFAILFVVILVWHTFKMFRDIFNGTKGVQQGSRETPRQGDVTIQRTSRTPSKRVNDDVGEYVDYKEIKDK